jgi:hypothetical protein
MGQFCGFVQLENTLPITALVAPNNAPINLDAAPTYRVYGPTGLLPGASGTMAFEDSKNITNASNASPIVVSCTNHGLTTGTKVTITGVTGNLAANGSFIVTVVNSSQFSLNGSTGNGAYGSGGVWNVTGLYTVTLTCAGSSGYESGETYSILVQGTISAVAYADLSAFVVT